MVVDLYKYRGLIFSSIKSEIKSSYSRSKLGVCWIIIQPLAQVVMYAIVLSAVIGAKLPGIDNQYAYAVYLISGLAGWSLFIDVVNRMVVVFTENAQLIKKAVFPKTVFIVASVGVSLVYFTVLLMVVMVVYMFIGHEVTGAILWLPVLIGITVMMGLGLGGVLGILNVFVRDVGQFAGVVLQFWFWLTPIVYSVDMLPDHYKSLFYYNPMVMIVEGYHDIFVYGKLNNFEGLVYPFVVGVFSVGVMVFMYIKADEEMADVL